MVIDFFVIILKCVYFKMQQRSLNMWDTVVKEVEDVGMGVASAVKDEIISIEKEVEKIESVAGKFFAHIYRSYIPVIYGIIYACCDRLKIG